MYGYGYGYKNGLVVGGGTPPPPFTNTYSLDFDGMDDYISTGYSYNAAVTPDLTLSFWFKSTSSSLFKFPVSIKTNGGVYIKSIVMIYGTRLLISDRTGFVFGNNTTINDGNWHNVIVTAAYSGNTTDGTLLNMYLDGNLTPDLTSANMGTGSDSYLDGELFIGNFNGVSDFYNCSVDEVAVWETILTPTEITSISAAPTDLTSLSPISWWRFEEGMGTTAIDSGSGGNNGTLINGVSYSTNVP